MRAQLKRAGPQLGMGGASKHKASRQNALEMMCQAAEAEYTTSIPVGDLRQPVKLEARVANQKTGEVCIIFCHALPPAGNMYIPEIGYLQAQLALQGYVTVRFNLRGVGLSEGNTFLRSATREMDDVRDVARWVRAHRAHFKLPKLRACWLVGISYGSVIASAAAHYPEFDGYVAVAYPRNYLWYCTTFDSHNFQQLAKSHKPKLFVWGDTDVFAGKDAMQLFFAELPQPKQSVTCVELDGMLGHYFRSKTNLSTLHDAVAQFLQDQGEKGLPRLAPTSPPPESAPNPLPATNKLAELRHEDAALTEKAHDAKQKKKHRFGFF